MDHTLGFDTSKFSKSVLDVIEDDYGDYMRILNRCLISLRSELDILGDHNISDQLDKMQLYLQFYPNWDVESTRKMLITDTTDLDELLLGHEQDWESGYLKPT